MKTTKQLGAAIALSIVLLFAFVGSAGAQTTDTTPGVGGDGYVAGVTTIAPQPQVEGATAVQSSGALPYTGSDSLPFIQIGVALIVAGAIVTFAVRKRNAAERA